jgi:ribose/xylose/arabinose/galactoside ABC-type transport system permease subunit
VSGSYAAPAGANRPAANLGPAASRQPSAAGERPAGLLAHLLWETVLLILTVVSVGIVLTRTEVDLNAPLWFGVAAFGLLATGFALSLRTATPNLAVAGIALLAGVVYAELAANNVSRILAGLVALLLVSFVGLVLGLVTGLSAAPAWAVSLGGLAIVEATAFGISDARGIFIPDSQAPGTAAGVLWAALFVIGSLAGGLVFLSTGVRRRFGANRRGADPTRWRSGVAAGAVVGLGGSSLLAGISGIVVTEAASGSFPISDTPRLLLAVGAALLGGVSVFGGRGGVAGTALASVLLVVLYQGLVATDSPPWMLIGGLPAAAILLGVGVSWVLERLAGPEPTPAPET